MATPTNRAKNGQRPTGIMRTLPWYGSEDSKHDNTERGAAYKRMMKGFKAMETNDHYTIVIALAQRPVEEILYCYIVIGNKVRVRANISRFIPGSDIGTVECWDGSDRNAKWWAELTGPVSWPPEEIAQRGFRGFRYVYEPLW